MVDQRLHGGFVDHREAVEKSTVAADPFGEVLQSCQEKHKTVNEGESPQWPPKIPPASEILYGRPPHHQNPLGSWSEEPKQGKSSFLLKEDG